ncbi:Glycosyltransferase 2-like [Arabidopsis thaliana x Arabidopsis arenosa]|uniref:Glycosyltransferase 2-like n=1 Tax=Arabidopsis thaliana x Arabidopsis arenosa TaxID=1240361 RepID=A0A8T1Y8X9_9BRAS|nr:Glycosyltransferase 2-like [Arabidopsis thaliana x Arabidopsis arenosa]
MAAMEEAGGWKDRTTVEDMDLAVCVGLLGWKFIFLNDLEVKSELPSQFKAFRFQQHRWSCGPANLFRKMMMEIIHNKIILPRGFLGLIRKCNGYASDQRNFIGLFEGGRVNEWVVTEKLGDTLNTKLLRRNGRLLKR